MPRASRNVNRLLNCRRYVASGIRAADTTSGVVQAERHTAITRFRVPGSRFGVHRFIRYCSSVCWQTACSARLCANAFLHARCARAFLRAKTKVEVDEVVGGVQRRAAAELHESIRPGRTSRTAEAGGAGRGLRSRAARGTDPPAASRAR